MELCLCLYSGILPVPQTQLYPNINIDTQIPLELNLREIHKNRNHVLDYLWMHGRCRLVGNCATTGLWGHFDLLYVYLLLRKEHVKSDLPADRLDCRISIKMDSKLCGGERITDISPTRCFATENGNLLLILHAFRSRSSTLIFINFT